MSSRGLPADPTAAAAPRAVEAIRAAALPLAGGDAELDPLVDRIGDAGVVLLGEATHGTHEFYAARSRLTKRLVEEHGFRAMAIEGDGPDAYEVNRFVRGWGGARDAREALAGFRRFPTWMWRNTDVLELVAWMRERNQGLPEERRAGFYGLDLYSLHGSMEAVLKYLEAVDPQAARRARARYACFERFRADGQEYGYATAFGTEPSCEQEVLRQLREMRERAAEFVQRDGRLTSDDHFMAEQNARLVKDAEEYYRSMFRGSVFSWNLRDRHMADTLAALLAHLDGTGPAPAKVVVWAHNSHVGDARATELGDAGEWNLGQLARDELRGRGTYVVGFTTHHGTVTAARDWGDEAGRRTVRPALAGSYEALFHATAIPRFLLFPGTTRPLPEPLLERAIGVVYRPETERASHWFEARLAGQFDAVLHFDATRAVEPLERTSLWDAGEAPETYPTGL